MSDSRVRLVYTEPNLYAAEAAGVKFGNGKIATNMTWNPEDLNISVDLQVVVPSRSDCGEITQDLPVSFSNGLGVYTSFLSGSKVGDGNYLTTDYTEASYSEIKNNSVSTTESLGISSIDIRFDAHFYPQVTMKFTDVRGYSLFMPAEEEYVNKLQTKVYNAGNATKPGRPYTNLFKAIFHFPYPKFLLTVKGFYGNKVTFILAVNDFKTALNGQNGNFDVTISFIGYMYGLYTDLPMSYIMIAPYMESKDGQLTDSSYWIKQQKAGRFVSKAANSSGEGENALQLIPTFLELARNYAELDIKSEDALGTETEEYYTIQSAYNSLDSIIKDYKELVNDFGYDSKLSLVSGKTDIYDLYLLNDKQEYSWNKNDKAKELYDKIAEHISKYSVKELSACTIEAPVLLRKEDKDANFTVKPSSLTTVKLDDEGKKPTHNNGDKIFVAGGDTYPKQTDDVYFENTLFGLLKKAGKDNNSYTLLAFKGEKWIKDTTKLLREIGKIRDKKMEDAAKSAVKLFSEKLGYALTIENVFRMLFAHVECFFHYYLENTVYKIKNSDRSFGSVGIDYTRTDSDGIAVNNTSKLLPFPAIYSERTNELVYPGADMRTVEMLEVALVEQLHEAAKMCGEEAEKVSELAALNQEQDYSGQYVSGSGVNFPLPISFDGSFKPLTFMDAFCDCKNPYTNIPTVKTGNIPYNFVDEILYMAYLRYCAYRLCMKETRQNSTYIDEYFITNEIENIKLAFPIFNKKFIPLKNNLKNLKNILEGRIGKDFSIPYIENMILCTGFDTASDNTSSNLSETLKRYTKDYLRGVHVFPASTFDVFKNMPEYSTSISGNTAINMFKFYNYLFDIREVSGTQNDYSLYVNTVVGTSDVSRNSVYYLGETQRKIQSDTSYGYCFLDVITNDDESKQVLNHNNKRSYFDFIKCSREDYVGLYSPNAMFLKDNVYKNLFLNKFFWEQESIEAQAYLLLSLFIGSNANQLLFHEDFSKVGVRTYRLRKLSVLYYGALINRLRHQIEDKTDLVNMNYKGDTLGINKDVFNTELGAYVKLGDYYYLKKEKRFTKDAPKLLLLSGKDSAIYNNFVAYNRTESYKKSKIYTDVIDILTDNEDKNKISLDDETVNTLIELINASDFSSGLEGYFLKWVETEFRTFLDTLKNEYFTVDENGLVYENDEIKPIKEKWQTVEFKNESGKRSQVYGFRYSEESDSPNMFLNRLQCEQATVFVCVPNEKTYENGLDNSTNFFNKASNILSNIAEKLDDYYSKQKEEAKATVERKVDEKRDVDTSNLKKATYYTLKNLYDKWICGYGKFDQFLLPTPHEEYQAKLKRYEQGDYYGDKEFREMNNFLFVDAFYNDISDNFYCNPKLLYDLIMSCIGGEYNCSVYQFMAKLAQDNKLLMKAFPVYNNFYNTDTINDIFTPHMSYDVANNSMSKRGFGSTYLLMYTNQPSKFLNEESKSEIIFRDDAFDLGDSLGHAAKLDTQFSRTEGALNIPVPAFGVTYGMQNQQYFKGMNITMDNPITTDYSIANTLMLSQTGAKGDKNFPMGVGQDIYAIYSNRSYTITVEMMGCVNIMPMMYFQLNNVPMFKGAYMIVSVSHSIKAGTMTTTFTGIRQSKYLYPTVNENMILTSIMDRINKERAGQGSTRSVPIYGDVKGEIFTNEKINIVLDNALGAKYAWSPKTTGEPYPYRRRKSNSSPKYIILHYTAGSSSVQGAAGKLMQTWVNLWNNSEDGGGSADFGVDDGNIYQFTPNINEWRASYCNGGTYEPDGRGGRTQHDEAHLCGIGIEMCCTHKKDTNFKVGNHHGWSFTDKVLDNTAKLCACLIHHYPTMACTQLKDLDSIISTHYLVSGKICPGIWGWNNARYNDNNGKPMNNSYEKPLYSDMSEFVKFKKRVWNYLVEYGYVNGNKVNIA